MTSPRDRPPFANLSFFFAIAAIGYPLGQIRVGGFSLGVAAVLFTGLAAGSLLPDLALPEIVYLLGLGGVRVFAGSRRRAGVCGFVPARGGNMLVLGMILPEGEITPVGWAFGLTPGRQLG